MLASTSPAMEYIISMEDMEGLAMEGIRLIRSFLMSVFSAMAS